MNLPQLVTMTISQHLVFLQCWQREDMPFLYVAKLHASLCACPIYVDYWILKVLLYNQASDCTRCYSWTLKIDSAFTKANSSVCAVFTGASSTWLCPLCPTRRTVRTGALDALPKNYGVIVQVLQEITKFLMMTVAGELMHAWTFVSAGKVWHLLWIKVIFFRYSVELSRHQ